MTPSNTELSGGVPAVAEREENVAPISKSKMREQQKVQKYVDRMEDPRYKEKAMSGEFKSKLFLHQSAGSSRDENELRQLREGLRQPPPGAGPKWAKNREKQLLKKIKTSHRRFKKHNKRMREAIDIVVANREERERAEVEEQGLDEEWEDERDVDEELADEVDDEMDPVSFDLPFRTKNRE